MLLLVCSLLLLPVAAAFALVAADPARGARIGARIVAVAALGAVGATALGPAGDAFDALVLGLVAGMGATILDDASRALRHEAYQRRFATIGPLLVLSTAVTAVASTLELMAIAWVATSILTVALIRTAQPWPTPRAASASPKRSSSATSPWSGPSP